MSRAHLFRPLQDAAGNLQRGATVRLLRPGTTTLISDPIYTSDDGEETFTQPVSCPTGFLSVFLANPRRVKVGVTPYGGGTEVFFDDIDVTRTFQRAAEVPLDAVGGLQSLDVQAAIKELQDTKYGEGSSLPRQTAFETTFEPPSGGSLVSTDVQGALTELMTEKYGPDVAPPPQTASQTPFTPAGGLSSTDVQAALVELDTEKATPAQITAAVTAHEAASDPHPQYLTQTGGDARYPLKTDTDPYPQYLTAAEGNAAYYGPGALALPNTPFVVKTANYTLTNSDGIVFFSGTSLTGTLPTPVGNVGRQFVVKNLDASILTLATTAGLIDGVATQSLAQYDSYTVVSDGTNWGVI